MLEVTVKGDLGEGKTTVAAIIRAVLMSHGFHVLDGDDPSIKGVTRKLYEEGGISKLRPKPVKLLSK